MRIRLLKSEDQQFFAKLHNLIAISILLFIAASIAGFLSSSIFPQIPERVWESFDQTAEQLLSFNSIELFFFIFINNSLKVIAATFLGFFFGFISLIFLLTNGFIVGLVAFTSTQSSGLAEFWLGILPHGIFEVPALILGTAAGLYLGDLLYRRVFFKEKGELKKGLKKVFYFSLRLIMPLLLIAAIIEVFITAKIIG